MSAAYGLSPSDLVTSCPFNERNTAFRSSSVAGRLCFSITGSFRGPQVRAARQAVLLMFVGQSVICVACHPPSSLIQANFRHGQSGLGAVSCGRRSIIGAVNWGETRRREPQKRQSRRSTCNQKRMSIAERVVAAVRSPHNVNVILNKGTFADLDLGRLSHTLDTIQVGVLLRRGLHRRCNNEIMILGCQHFSLHQTV